MSPFGILKGAAIAPVSVPKTITQEDRNVSRTVSVKEKFDQSEIDRIVEDEKKIVSKFKKGKYSEYKDEEAEDEEDDEVGLVHSKKRSNSNSQSLDRKTSSSMLNKFQEYKSRNMEKAQTGKMEEEHSIKKRGTVVDDEDEVLNDNFVVRDEEDDQDDERLAKSKIHTFNNKSGVLGLEDMYI